VKDGGASEGAAPSSGPVSGVPLTCDDAVKSRSYIGCEYWPTVTLNTELYNSFQFAVVAANPTGSPAQVTAERGSTMLAQVTVGPGKLEIIQLPWVQELKQAFGTDGSKVTSALVPGGAFHVTSSVPITIKQFNPLEFELTPPPKDCPGVSDTGHCYSYTNDASLLLPTTALRGEYYVMSYPTHHYSVRPGPANSQINPLFNINTPGFVTVTATEDDTTVTVDSTANVRAGTGVAALSAGSSASYQLSRGDVLELATAALPDGDTPLPPKACKGVPNGAMTDTFCPAPSTYDLTGSHVTSNKPISVIGGHDCTMIPYDTFACDHLEQSLLPVDTLGQDIVITAPQGAAGNGPDPMFVRVLSAVDGNKITFDPPAVAAPVTLDAGKWIEVGPVSQDFRVVSDNKILVAQFMVGANYGTTPAPGGDPSESIGIPAEQYRQAYTFYAPSTYTSNYVNIVAPTGATITLDGSPIDSKEFAPLGASGITVARHALGGGAHSMKSDRKFGIVVYGYGRYTSYMYPGGLNLETIKVVPGSHPL
jgi:hypothetical protein